MQYQMHMPLLHASIVVDAVSPPKKINQQNTGELALRVHHPLLFIFPFQAVITASSQAQHQQQ